MRQELLNSIAAYCEANAMSEWQFGELAVRDRHFVRAFRAGRNIQIDTLAKVQAQLAAPRPSQTDEQARAA